MAQIIIAIVAVIAILFFIKKYTTIDDKLFNNGVDEFKPMGKVAVYVSVCLGAIIGFVVAIYSMFGEGNPFALGFTSWGIVCNIVPYLLIACIAVCFYMAYANERTPNRRLGRALFMTVACLLGFVGGFVGSILVLVALLLWLLLKLVLTMLTDGASSSSKAPEAPAAEEQYDATTTDEHGFERKLKSTGFGGYIDDKGDHWKDADNGTVVRDK